MATRIYLGNGGFVGGTSTGDTGPLVPDSWSAGWNKTTGALARAANSFKSAPVATAQTVSLAASGTSGHYTALSRFVLTRALAAQTISGNIKGQLYAQESAAGDNCTLAVAIKVVQADGADRGVLLAVTASDDTSATPPELETASATNRRMLDASESASIALSSLAVSGGDYLVIEAGVRQASTSTGLQSMASRAEISTGTDAPEDDTTTLGRQHWIEFDSDLTFLDANDIQYYGSNATPTDSASAANTADPTSVTPPSGMQSGDLVLMIGQLRTATAVMTVSATGGQTWTTETAVSTTNQTARLFWCTFNGTWSADPSVDFPSATCNSVVMHVFRPRGGSATTWAVNQAQVELDIAAAATQTITGQTTTGNNPTLTFAGWFTADDNTWGDVSQGWEVTGNAQYRNTSSTDQSATFAHKVKTSPGATGDVAKTQKTLGNDAATSLIITFAASWPRQSLMFNPLGHMLAHLAR